MRCVALRPGAGYPVNWGRVNAGRGARPQSTRRTAGGFQVPLRIDGGVSLGQ